MTISFSEKLPAGSITQYAGASAPAGWLLMYGQAISRVTYKALFDAIGTVYGAGDGSTTFNVPDARGRALLGKDNMGGTAANRLTSGGGGLDGATLGAVGGGETKTLTTGQIPSHAHQEQALNTVGSATAVTEMSGLSGSQQSIVLASSGKATIGGALNTVAAGSGGAHSVIQPGLVINYIIKT